MKDKTAIRGVYSKNNPLNFGTDHEHRGNHCKYLRGAEFASGRREIPEWADRDAINNTLRAHIDTGPVFVADAEPDAVVEATGRAMTDGSAVAETADETELDDRPDDCDCIGEFDDDALGCWPCYRDGNETANPDAENVIEEEGSR